MIVLLKSHKFNLLIKLVALIGIFVAIANYLTYDLISRILTFQTLLAFLIMQVPLFVATCLNAYRHSLLVRAPPAPFHLCLIALLLAAGLNLIIPARLSEFVKVSYLRKACGITLPSGIAAIFIERLYDVLVVATIALLGFLSFQFEHAKIIIILSLCLLFFIFYLRNISSILIRYIGKPKSSLNKYLLAHLHHIANLMDIKLIVYVGGISIFSWVIHCSSFWLFFYTLNKDALSLAEICFVFGVVMFAGALPSLPGGIGVVQLAVSGILINYGIDTQEAFLISLILHFSLIFISAVVAPFLILTQATGIQALSRDAKTQISNAKR